MLRRRQPSKLKESPIEPPFRAVGPTPEKLAAAVGITKKQLQALISAGYIQIRTPKPGQFRGNKVRVVKAVYGSWPRVTLAQIARRPPIVRIKTIRDACIKFGIEYQRDPWLGDWITPEQTHQLLIGLRAERHPRTIDRVSLILWLGGMETPDPRQNPRFDIEMEKEARRVARLPEPQRTEQALRLLLRYRDAKVIIDTLCGQSKEDLQKRLEVVRKTVYYWGKAAGVN